MKYKEYMPSGILKPYIKCFYSLEMNAHEHSEDMAYATGCIELMFNLSESRLQTNKNGHYLNGSSIELWGQLIEPMQFRVAGNINMIGVRFYPATAALFFDGHIRAFNNEVVNCTDISHQSIEELHAKLLYENSVCQKIVLVERYLARRMNTATKQLGKVKLVSQIIRELNYEGSFEKINTMAAKYNISSRHLQNLFIHTTGISPKLYHRIFRFQQSLKLITAGNNSLTGIAYQCGYFDQSHFIKEFLSFTNTTPSGFNTNALSAAPLLITA